jgi:hypothetical protein
MFHRVDSGDEFREGFAVIYSVEGRQDSHILARDFRGVQSVFHGHPLRPVSFRGFEFGEISAQGCVEGVDRGRSWVNSAYPGITCVRSASVRARPVRSPPRSARIPFPNRRVGPANRKHLSPQLGEPPPE